MRVWSLCWEDPLKEGMATHSSILSWRIPWTEEPGGLQSMGLQRVGHWSNLAQHTHTIIYTFTYSSFLPHNYYSFTVFNVTYICENFNCEILTNVYNCVTLTPFMSMTYFTMFLKNHWMIVSINLIDSGSWMPRLVVNVGISPVESPKNGSTCFFFSCSTRDGHYCDHFY